MVVYFDLISQNVTRGAGCCFDMVGTSEVAIGVVCFDVAGVRR